jgi:undecaprenyl-diphosphatase
VTPTEPGASGVGARPTDSAPTTGRSKRGPRGLDIELALACVLLAGVGVASVIFMARPEPTVFDRWVFAVIPTRPRSEYVIAVTRLGSPLVVAGGSVAAFLATLRRNRARATALLVAPGATVAASDWILKPVVGRTFDGVLSFPSGSVAVVAALATVAVLATPDRLRWGAGVVGATMTVLMALAVIALGWHYPTDTVGGLGVGIGTVLLFDCVARRLATSFGRARPGPEPSLQTSEAERLARR